MQDYFMLINGQLVPGAKSFDVIDPANESVLARCPWASEEQLNEAVAAAKSAFPAWASTPIAQRSALLVKIADAIDADAPNLARLLTQEQGKPLPEAEAEILYSALFIRRFATFSLEPKTIEDSEGRLVEVHRRPLGVVAAIVPWNFPVLIATYKFPFALLAGNTVVLKPAPTTPLTMLRIASLVADILPPGVFNVIADQNDLGQKLAEHPSIAKISFTGSTATGRKVMASAASTLKRMTLELGGNDAAIVLGDVDPVAVAKDIYGSAFMNAGQVCIAIKRVYAHADIYDALCDELARLADAAIVDDGLKQGVQMGPLQNKAQFDKVKALLEEARGDGAIVAGGVVEDRPGYFVRPTIIRDITDGSRLVDEEQFGPILPIVRYEDVEDALRSANASEYGLGGSIWSKDRATARDLALRMEAGTVWINKHLDFGPDIPFAGAKQSGIGVEVAQDGLDEYTQIQVLNEAR
ncbi:aldehyde dehydrogenase family protein [Sphingobium boeckii]|uniref:Acyl-CoA reductase-like NAD-dependent aldehyde dehydrogenase n=1 Tax=Sphingobium boeckii TaxID=1082345 RepID=A0A7W9AHA4_9SPHN|nr:aldehyde dehydrogenase family protein [Sphingobium boeckii]MBB5685687.1 acyl-CoA reductase-like NAD-dependent aldehyde dehydrogenase [Sphingobium boeckii]